MTIEATCPKGHTLTLEERLAGKKIRCPRCQSVFEVPDPNVEEAEEAEEAEEVRAKPARKVVPKKKDDDEPPRRKVRQPAKDEDDDDDEEEERPRRKARRPVVEDDDEEEEEEELDWETERKLERREKKKALKLVDIGMLLHTIKLHVDSIALIGFTALIVFLVLAYARAEDIRSDSPKAKVVVLTLDMEVLRDKAPKAVADPAQKTILVRPADNSDQGTDIGGYYIDIIVLFIVMLFIGLLAPLLGLAGSILCCWIPKKSDARGSIIISLCFDVITLLAWLLFTLASAGVFGMDHTKTLRMMQLLWVVTALGAIISWLLFLTFERNLGKYIGDARLGNEALNRIVGLALQVLFLGIALILNILSGTVIGGTVGSIIGCAAIGLWLLYYLFFFLLRVLRQIRTMRTALADKL